MTACDHRSRLIRHLAGAGLEVGPGHVPLVMSNAWLAVRYVDRWEPERNAELFPELEGATFPEPDVVLDLNRDALGPISDNSQDFIVCSHVLEHLANPLRAITDFHRVLRPGGTLLILLPDRRRTFDKDRLPTPLEHVVADFNAGVTEVDEDHLIEFLANTDTDKETLQAIATNSEERAKILELHRSRSIHVHCWIIEEFVPIVSYSIEELGNRWEFVNGLLIEEQGPDAFEFGLVIRKSTTDLPPPSVAKQFEESFEDWMGCARQAVQDREAAAEQISQLTGALQQLKGRLEEAEAAEAQLQTTQQSLAALEHEMQALLATKTLRYTAGLRLVYGRLRGLFTRNG